MKASKLPVRVCILDYGSGNVRSVFNRLESHCERITISNSSEDIAGASHLILPGVGSFGRSMERIQEKLPLDLLRQRVLQEKTPFLGICVGMQVLANVGHEFGTHPGLGWIEGEVGKLESGDERLPHVGWNDLEFAENSWLGAGLGPAPDFYFVHSFAMVPSQQSQVLARCQYGERFVAIVEKENIVGVQFHPEKSQSNGLKLLRNFLVGRT